MPGGGYRESKIKRHFIKWRNSHSVSPTGEGSNVLDQDLVRLVGVEGSLITKFEGL
jgi:hypothetical protein